MGRKQQDDDTGVAAGGFESYHRLGPLWVLFTFPSSKCKLTDS